MRGPFPDPATAAACVDADQHYLMHYCGMCGYSNDDPSAEETDDGAGTSTATPSPADGATSLPAPSLEFPRLFVLDRLRDVTGKSGTGVVVEGAVWSDGTVSVRWVTEHRSFANWPTLDDLLAVHGHDGATELRWLDGDA